MSERQTRSTLAVLVKGWPRLSETFIAQEILALEQAGFDITLYSLRHPTDDRIHALHKQIQAKVVYLPEYLHQEPGRVLAGLWHAIWNRTFSRALNVWVRDLWRDRTRNRIRRFGQACVFLREVRPDADVIYAHFMHTPGSVGYYAHLMSGVPFGMSAHAKDIWTIEDWEKREKLDKVRFIATCTATNVAHLRALTDDPERVQLVYHGLNARRFPDPSQLAARTSGGTVTLITVARIVPKKGLDLLLKAFAMLPANLDWRWRHIGGGHVDPLLDQMEQLGLETHISFEGAQDHSYVIDAYAQSDIFVLPSRIAEDGDRDGMPNVLMEAMLMELAVIATDVSAIPELVNDGKTGVLVPPDDVRALATALEDLIRDYDHQRSLGAAGRQRVLKSFQMDQHIDHLVDLLDRASRS